MLWVAMTPSMRATTAKPPGFLIVARKLDEPRGEPVVAEKSQIGAENERRSGAPAPPLNSSEGALLLRLVCTFVPSCLERRITLYR